jgi:hypothetical protein
MNRPVVPPLPASPGVPLRRRSRHLPRAVPAGAGMNRRGLATLPRARRVPRRRGDEPVIARLDPIRVERSPQARGSITMTTSVPREGADEPSISREASALRGVRNSQRGCALRSGLCRSQTSGPSGATKRPDDEPRQTRSPRPGRGVFLCHRAYTVLTWGEVLIRVSG